MDAVTLEGVSKSFDGLTAVSALNLKIPQGSFFGLLGPNGAGKTTSLRMLLRIIVPDEGTIHILGQPLAAATQDRIGYLPEERGLYPRMQVRQALVFLGSLAIWGLWDPQAWQEATFFTFPVFTFAGGAFAMDAYFKQGGA